MTAKEWIELSQSASVFFASAVAIFGIDAWRREFVGKRRMELAEEVLALFYQSKDNIASMRGIYGFAGEGETRKRHEGESPARSEALDRAFVLIERYGKHADTFFRLHALRYRFMAQFGKAASRPFDDLNMVINELIGAAHQMGSIARHSGGFPNEAAMERFHNELRKVEAIYFAGFNSDPIAPRVEALVLEMESTCRDIIKSKGTLFGLINLRIFGRGDRDGP